MSEQRQETQKLDETQAHVRSITEKQLEEAVKKQRQTGKKLWEILMSDLSLQSMKDLLTYEIWPRGRTLKDVMVEGGYATEDELAEGIAREASETLHVGEVLIDRGLITRAQLGRALIEQERTGHNLGRVLLNLGFVTAKHLADAMRMETPAVAKSQLRRQRILKAAADKGLINESQIVELLKEAEISDQDLPELLVSRGIATSEELGRIMQEELGVTYVSLTSCKIEPDVAKLIPPSLARSRSAMPLTREDGRLVVAMTDPTDITAIDDLSMITGSQVEPVLVWETQLRMAMDKIYGATPDKKEQLVAPHAETPVEKPTAVEQDGDRLSKLVENVSVVNLVASIIEGAIHAEATDIHLEPQADHVRVRYRIDGMLYDVMTIPQDVGPALISRVKILANMDITQKRIPQDGHYSMKISDRAYDMRIATLPTSLGERLVVRLLNPGDIFLGMKQLGLSADNFVKIEKLIYNPNGMVLVTGPIGSGKTTTQYAALNRINVLTDSIVTIEDPIEYQLPGINQVQVDPRIDRTFANILRAVLRQDVNTLLVGEIRDFETARIAVRAAVTGHLVFSTLHTRNAVGAISTLLNLEVPPFLVAGSVTGIVNQRLVRRVCSHCAEKYTPSETLLRELQLEPSPGDELTFVRGTGCRACYHTGYHGRVGIFEILLLTDSIKELILNHASEEEIQNAAQKAGMQTLYDDAIAKLKAKQTSAEEIIRTILVHV